MRELPFKVGDEIKNYKEMCKLLDEKERKANSKKSQMKRWEDYFEWENTGHKFIITKILQTQYPTHDDNQVGRMVKEYNQYIQKLILNTLYYYLQNRPDAISLNISNKGLVGALNVFNHVFYNLSFDKSYREHMAKELSVKEAFLKDFFQRMNSTAQNDIKSALKQLQRKGIIYVNETILVKPILPYNKGIPIKQMALLEDFLVQHRHEELIQYFTEEYGVISENVYNKNLNEWNNNKELQESRVGTEFEQSALLLCENLILKKLGIKTMQHAYAQEKINEVRKEVSKLSREYLGIDYFYKGYQIIFSKPILEEKSKLSAFRLNKDTIESLENIVKEELSKNIQENYERRFHQGLHQIENSKQTVLVWQQGESECKEVYMPESIPQTIKLLHSIDSIESLDKVLKKLFSISIRDY